MAGHLRLMSHLSTWLGEQGFDDSALSTEAVDRLVLNRRAGGYRDGRSVRSLRPLLEYLHELELVPSASPQRVLGPVEVILADHSSCLVQ